MMNTKPEKEKGIKIIVLKDKADVEELYETLEEILGE